MQTQAGMVQSVSDTNQYYLQPYTGGTEAVSHKEVKGGTGLNPSGINAATAVLQNSLTEVGTLLHFLFKQKISTLKRGRRKEKKPVTWGAFRWLALSTAHQNLSLIHI